MNLATPRDTINLPLGPSIITETAPTSTTAPSTKPHTEHPDHYVPSTPWSLSSPPKTVLPFPSALNHGAWYVRACGTCFTSSPMSWHPTARTTGFFDVERSRARVLRSLLFCSVNFMALLRQKSSLRWGGVHDKWPDSSSEEYSSNVLYVLGGGLREGVR